MVSRKATSPVLATLMMIAVAVSLSILTYVWAIGLTGYLMGGGGSQVRDQLIIDAYNWPVGANAFTVTLRNVGSTAITISAVYVGGVLASYSGTGAIAPGAKSDLTVTASTASLADGVAYTLMIVTQTAGVFAFVVMRGSSG